MTGQERGEAASWFDGRVRLLSLDRHVDPRGALLPVEFERLPFLPQRLFTVSGMAAGTERGGHAHRKGQQILLCLQGLLDLCLRVGEEQVQVTLRPDGPGLLVGAMVWCRQTYVTEGTVLLVLASEPYDPESYIEGWEGA
mgnify:CR=1 FL=1